MAQNLIKGDTTIKGIKPGDPRKRLGDGDGLYLLLFVKGGAHGWRFDYAHSGNSQQSRRWRDAPPVNQSRTAPKRLHANGSARSISRK